jgi:hypothetical protein
MLDVHQGLYFKLGKSDSEAILSSRLSLLLRKIQCERHVTPSYDNHYCFGERIWEYAVA